MANRPARHAFGCSPVQNRRANPINTELRSKSRIRDRLYQWPTSCWVCLNMASCSCLPPEPILLHGLRLTVHKSRFLVTTHLNRLPVSAVIPFLDLSVGSLHEISCHFIESSIGYIGFCCAAFCQHIIAVPA
jgi:hypothetical protein